MGSTLTLALNWLRAYIVNNVPSSGPNNPSKSDGIATLTDADSRLTALETATAGGAVTLAGAQTITGVKTFSAAPNVPDPTTALQPVNFEYFNANAPPLYNFTTAVNAATTAPLPANTYANGTAGVGATLTGTANAALAAQDGVTLTVNQRLWVKNEAAPANNGIYVLTQVGSGSLPYILTRAADANTPTLLGRIAATVLAGTANAGLAYGISLAGTAITIGTTALNPVLLPTGGAVAAETARAQAAEAALAGATINQGVSPPTAGAGASGNASSWFSDTPISNAGVLQTISFYSTAAGTAVLILASFDAGFTTATLQNSFQVSAVAGLNTITLWNPNVQPGWFVGVYIYGTTGTYSVTNATVSGRHLYGVAGILGPSGGSITSFNNSLAQIGWSIAIGITAETGRAETAEAALSSKVAANATTISANATAIAALQQFIPPRWAARNGITGDDQSNEGSGFDTSVPILTTQPYSNVMPSTTGPNPDGLVNSGPDINYMTDNGDTITGETPLLVKSTVGAAMETTFCESANYASLYALNNWNVATARLIYNSWLVFVGGQSLSFFIKGTSEYTRWLGFVSQMAAYYAGTSLKGDNGAYAIQAIVRIGNESVTEANAGVWQSMFITLAQNASEDIANVTGQQTPAYTLGVETANNAVTGVSQQGLLSACQSSPLCCFVTPDYIAVRFSQGGAFLHWSRVANLLIGAYIGRAIAQLMGAPAAGIKGRKPDFLNPVSLYYTGLYKGSKVILTFNVPTPPLALRQLTLAGATDWSDADTSNAGYRPRPYGFCLVDASGTLLSTTKATAFGQVALGANGVSVEFTLDRDVSSSGGVPTPIRLSTGGCGLQSGLVMAPGLQIGAAYPGGGTLAGFGSSCDLADSSADTVSITDPSIPSTTVYNLYHHCPIFGPMTASPMPT